MDKTRLVDLKRKLFIRSALISLDGLDKILGLNDYLSADEILLEIIKKALKEYEATLPLILDMPINAGQLESCTAPNGYFEIKSNFSQYLQCIIPEDRIILVPNSTPKWRISSLGAYPMVGSYEWVVDYKKPYVCLGDLSWMGGGDILLRGICSRPVVPDFLPDKTFNPESEVAAVYWMDIENGGSRENYFLDLCLVHLLDYIRQLKASIQLMNVPLDVMGNVDSAYQEYRQRTEMFAMQSGWGGELFM